MTIELKRKIDLEINRFYKKNEVVLLHFLKSGYIRMATGYLEIFMGPMFSGKTSKLLELYKQYTFCNMSVLVINHSADTRYSTDMMSTHDKIMIPCMNTHCLSDLLKSTTDASNIHIPKAEIILINEGQFFEDLDSFVRLMLQHKKKIYIAALDGDFERKKFGQILDLIPLCDKVTKLTSLCGICKDGTAGIFSLRLTKEATQTLIGSTNYVPVCRGCYDSTFEKVEQNNFVTFSGVMECSEERN